ncbi:MAG: hypothetical protein ACK4K9_10660 [Bacteroidia bacterium]
MKNFFVFISTFIVLIFAISSCKKIDKFTNEPVTLTFSTDTIFFDTIFSRLGSNPHLPRSVTLQVRVTNTSKEAVKTQIAVEGNQYGIFAINADGRSGSKINDVEILGNDSIYVFVQAYMDNVNSNTPFIVTDRLLFNTNGKIQDVKLVAWAQDAYYYQNEVLDCSSGSLFWTADKPHVIYDSILIPKGCTLTIDAGTRIHSFTRSAILVQGTLIVNGTPDNNVIFEGSRLDDDYKELPGQWIGIRFLPGSINNVINGTTIKNGYIGIEVDSLPANGNPNLVIEQSKIFNMSAVGILNYSAHTQATNNLIYNCGLFAFVGELGGTYNLKHNTMVMPGATAGRKDAGCYLSNSPYTDINGNIFKFPLQFTMQNNIITGPIDNEFFVNNNPNGQPISTAIVEHNILKTTNNNYSGSGNLLNRNPLFKDVQKQNYNVSGNSPAKNAGKSIGVFRDIINRNRNTITPTIGAYEAE